MLDMKTGVISSVISSIQMKLCFLFKGLLTIVIIAQNNIQEYLFKKCEHRPKFTMWCCKTYTKVVGHYNIRKSMNAEWYLAMPEDYSTHVVQSQ